MILAVIIGLFLISAIGVMITQQQMLTFFGILAFGLVILFLLLLKGHSEDPMIRATKHVKEYIKQEFKHDVTNINSYREKRFFPPNANPFFGFIFRRSSGERANFSIAVVSQQAGQSFNVHKARELSDDEARKCDPFIVMSTGFMGSPIPDVAPEQFLMPMMKSRKDMGGVEVNVHQPKEDEWNKVTKK